MSAVVDPRSITGAAYAQGQRPAPVRRPPPQQVASSQLPGNNEQVSRPRRVAIRTRPIPTHQPLPRLFARGTARLTLLIGPDGRVREVNVERPLSRDTADLVSAVSRWRFKPATENGEPVSAPYSVDISFTQ